jgi:hypothetical protein
MIMTTNTSFASLFSYADAAEILKLASTVDISGMDAAQLAEYQDALACLKEKVRIDAEYQQDVNTQPKVAAPKHEIHDASKVGCTNLADAAFVPGDDDDEVIPTIVDDDDEDVVIQKGFRGDPDDGMHNVILVDYPDRQPGKNGNSDYRILHFRDAKLFNEWTVFVSEDDLVKRLQEISYNNRGMLSGLTKKKAFASMMMNPVACWTVKNQKGRVVTYFDEVHFNKYLAWVQSQKAAAEDAYAQRHSKEVSRDEKELPWKC